MKGSTMTMVLIDMALVAIAAVACASLMQSGRKFLLLFAQLRAEMAQGVPTQAMLVTTRSTTIASVVEAAPIYRQVSGVAANPAGALAIRPRGRRRPAALRAAA
jgi:uncharacterized protein YcfJ